MAGGPRRTASRGGLSTEGCGEVLYAEIGKMTKSHYGHKDYRKTKKKIRQKKSQDYCEEVQVVRVQGKGARILGDV